MSAQVTLFDFGDNRVSDPKHVMLDYGNNKLLLHFPMKAPATVVGALVELNNDFNVLFAGVTTLDSHRTTLLRPAQVARGDTLSLNLDVSLNF